MVALCMTVFSLNFSESIKRIEDDLRQLGIDRPERQTGLRTAQNPVAIVPVTDGVAQPNLQVGRLLSAQEPDWHLRKAWAYRGGRR